jgi:hypothetical protein
MFFVRRKGRGWTDKLFLARIKRGIEGPRSKYATLSGPGEEAACEPEPNQAAWWW